MPTRQEDRDFQRLPGVVAGVVVFALILTAGWGYLATQPPRWSAKSAVLVLPVQGRNPATAPDYYETLSRGQIVETFAQILRLPSFEAAAASRLGLSEAARRDLDASVQVAPNTAMITITVTAPDRGEAELMADGIVAGATTYIRRLASPYQATIVSPARGNAERAGPNRGVLVAVVLLVALIGGVATQQVVQQLSIALERRRPVAWRPPRRGQQAR